MWPIPDLILLLIHGPSGGELLNDHIALSFVAVVVVTTV
jgi:hypothetical protein